MRRRALAVAATSLIVASVAVSAGAADVPAPASAARACGSARGGDFPLTALHATHLRCPAARRDAVAWLRNVESGRCGSYRECRVHTRSPTLSLQCRAGPKHYIERPIFFTYRVTCTARQHRLTFVLNNT